jgi:hypothetical protein
MKTSASVFSIIALACSGCSGATDFGSLAKCDGPEWAWYRPVPGDADRLSVGVTRDLSFASVPANNGRLEQPAEACSDGNRNCLTSPISISLSFDDTPTWETSAHWCSRRSSDGMFQGVVCVDKKSGWKTEFRYSKDQGVVSFKRVHSLKGVFPYELTSQCGLFSEPYP